MTWKCDLTCEGHSVEGVWGKVSSRICRVGLLPAGKVAEVTSILRDVLVFIFLWAASLGGKPISDESSRHQLSNSCLKYSQILTI